MEHIAFDAHKHYTWARVERADGTVVRERRIPHASTCGPRRTSFTNCLGLILVMSRGCARSSRCSGDRFFKMFSAYDFEARGSISTAPTISKPAAWNPSERPPHPAKRSRTRGVPPRLRRLSFSIRGLEGT